MWGGGVVPPSPIVTVCPCALWLLSSYAFFHPASAGHGLNLQQGGHSIVWFSVPWSLELYQQTVDRLYRQGQASETVSVIHLVTKGTIDERIVKALRMKDSTQSALIAAVKAVLR